MFNFVLSNKIYGRGGLLSIFMRRWRGGRDHYVPLLMQLVTGSTPEFDLVESAFVIYK